MVQTVAVVHARGMGSLEVSAQEGEGVQMEPMPQVLFLKQTTMLQTGDEEVVAAVAEVEGAVAVVELPTRVHVGVFFVLPVAV